VAVTPAGAQESAAEALDDMIEGELEIGRALAQSPTEARRSERWRQWRADHDAQFTILLALRREGVDLGSVEELFNEYRRRGIEAGVSTIWQPDRDSGE
jgi:chorismate-pyruvate lyase